MNRVGPGYDIDRFGQRSEASLGVLRTQEMASDGRPTQLLTHKVASLPDEFGEIVITNHNLYHEHIGKIITKEKKPDKISQRLRKFLVSYF